MGLPQFTAEASLGRGGHYAGARASHPPGAPVARDPGVLTPAQRVVLDRFQAGRHVVVRDRCRETARCCLDGSDACCRELIWGTVCN